MNINHPRGAALRYHLKKALSRSLDYDDFKIKLTDQLKKGTFTSKTKIFLDEFLKNVESMKTDLSEKSVDLTRTRAEKINEKREIGLKNKNIKEKQSQKIENHIRFLDENKEKIPVFLSKDEFLRDGFLREIKNKENFIKHLESRDKKRLDYLNLVEPTLRRYGLSFLSEDKNQNINKAYLKAFEGKNKDLFYILLEERDGVLFSAYPITKKTELKRILRKAEEIKMGEPPAAVGNLPKLNKADNSDYIISQKANKNFIKRKRKLDKVLKLSDDDERIIRENCDSDFSINILKTGIEKNAVYVEKILEELKALESMDKQSKQYTIKLKELDKKIKDYWENFVGEDLMYCFKETQTGFNINDNYRKWGKEKFEHLQNAFIEQIINNFETLKRENEIYTAGIKH